MKLSLVIPTKNDAQNLRLASVLQEMRGLPVEIIVVDWGSEVPVDTPDFVRCIRVPPEISKWYDQDSYFAFVIAFNVGCRRATGEFIAYIGNDTFCDETLLNWLESAEPDHLYVVSRKNIESIATKDQGKVNKISMNYGSGGGFLAHRTVWHALRGFDQKYIYYGWTDAETVERAKLLGYKAGCLYDVSVYHIRHPHSRMRAAGRINEKVFPKAGLVPTVAVVNDEHWGLGDVHLDGDAV
jgi:hypothetical protein